MSIKEKVAYLKGLAEGLGLDPDVKVEKLVSVIIDTLSVIADEVEEMGDNIAEIDEGLDAISEDLAEVEDYLFGDDQDDDFDEFDFDDEDDDDDEFDDECGCAYCSEGGFSYEVNCPACGVEIELNESDLAHESVKCTNCGEELEFDYDVYDSADGEDDQDGEE